MRGEFERELGATLQPYTPHWTAKFSSKPKEGLRKWCFLLSEVALGKKYLLLTMSATRRKRSQSASMAQRLTLDRNESASNMILDVTTSAIDSEKGSL